MQNIWLALITGLTTGGISCLAVQGGLLTSAVTSDKNSNNAQKVLVFLIFKLIAYAILGLLLGTIGSFLVLTSQVQAALQILVGIFLIGTAGRLLNLHPIFRYFVITPPKSVFKLARKISKNPTFVTPAMVGALTVFIPCGVTQAMMMLALASGDAIQGSLIMSAFILGTSPLFFILGSATLNMLKNKSFSYVAALIVFVFGLISINGAMGLLGSNITFQNLTKQKVADAQNDTSQVAGITSDGFQEVTIKVENTRYVPSAKSVQSGTPVRLRLVTNKTFGCSRAFTIPSLKISRILPETGEEIIEFTPSSSGVLKYTCSMGMYTGSLNVI